jgi:hypothetical protein
MTLLPDDPSMDACGCCEPEPLPPGVSNRPGLPAIQYRIGTHPTFLRRMLARLPLEQLTDLPPGRDRPLAALTTRADDDPTVAVLDAWATVADVLTFYQERIANEGYLRTATERRSILELARAIGYELNPGVAASTHLVFAVESAPGAPGVATVPVGTRAQSIPGQNERPQTFETVEAITAYAAWNALRPQLTSPQSIETGTTALYLKGVATQLQPGDGILIVGDEREKHPGSERWDFRILDTVTARANKEDPDRSYTAVTWTEGLGGTMPPVTAPAAKNVRVYAFRLRAALFGHNAPDWRTMPDTVRDDFGSITRAEWPDFRIRTVAESAIDLDAAYPKVLAGSWIVLRKPGWTELYKATRVALDSRTDFALTGKTTRITLDTNEHLPFFGLRATVVYAHSESLEMIDRPLDVPLHGDVIPLEEIVSGLAAGQALAVGGKRARVQVTPQARALELVTEGTAPAVSLAPGDLLTVVAPPLEVRTGGQTIPISPDDLARILAAGGTSPSIQWTLSDRDGVIGTVTAGPDQLLLQPAAAEDAVIHEVAFILRTTSNRDRTTLTLDGALQNSFDRATVAINANVARATHGETVTDEVLGNGDGAATHQRFMLKKPPATYVSAPTPTGAQSTLVVRVNDVQWTEASSLYGLGSSSQFYTVRHDDAANSQVVFGDGEQGARLPTGQQNVKVTYRSGIGLAGLVDAGTITLLQTRPLGIRSVSNPLPATGAADAETLDAARVNAPLTVLTLDRIVSLRDFEDFARAFAGVGKARAVALWADGHVVVHVTVASVTGDAVLPDSDLYLNLVAAIDAHRDPGTRVTVASFRRCTFGIEAKVLVALLYEADLVFANVRTALLDAFSFARREFGQPVTAAEVITTIQSVQGVEAVDLDALVLQPPCGTGAATAASMLEAGIARRIDEVTDLLLVDAAAITLTEMTR